MAWEYTARRMLQVVPALMMILLVTFSLIHFAPGDPARVFAGEYADEATIRELERQYGLDQSLPQQFVKYVGNVARGDLGDSYIYARPVTTIIGERLRPTLLLAASALVLSLTFGILIGALAARRSGAIDGVVTSATLLGYAIPAFWLGQVAILLIGLRWDFLPTLGMEDARANYQGLDHVIDVSRHLVLPATVLAVSELALVTRLTRTGLRQQMGEEYVRTARAKGLRRGDAIDRHAFPNAALPLITVIGTRVGFLFSGAVVIETVFSWPGVGQLLVKAVNDGDRPMVLGLVLIVAFSVLIANVITDLVYAWVDPRIRYN